LTDFPRLLLFSTIIVFAENDSKVDVEAFKKKIKNSQVRSVCYSSFFVCVRFEKKEVYLTEIKYCIEIADLFVSAEKKKSWTECIRNTSKKEKKQELRKKLFI